jgi:hypothetical protein
MPALQFILTTAGKNAIVNANNTGTNPITIAKVGIGSASWTPTAAATALQTEIKKITTISGAAVADDTIHVTASDTSNAAYTVREIGLFTSDDILVAVYSQSAAIITKGASTVALIAADLVITGVPAGSVTVGDASFNYPQATETVKGVAEIATTAEAQAGTDNERIITPKKLQDVTATETRKGVVELATDAETQTGTDTSRAITPANLSARTATDARTGVVELATDAEVQTGTDTTRAVTPAGLASRTATETRTGVVELATSAEVQAGSDTGRAVTPAGLASRTATDARTGVVELATSAEVQAGSDTARAVTPAGLASRTATETRTGVVELATAAEAQAGNDTARAVTPAGLASVTSTATRAGLIELATQAETDAGDDTVRAISPNRLKLYPGTARAWVVFNGQGTVSITSSFKVSSITDLGTGRYTVNWDNAFGSSNYCYVACARQFNDIEDAAVVSPRLSQTKTTSALQLTVVEGSSLNDVPEVCVAAFA